MSNNFDYQGLWETPMSKFCLNSDSFIKCVILVTIHKNEKASSVTIQLTIIGLELHDGNCCLSMAAREPANASVQQSISDSSFEYKLILKPDGNDKNVRRYKWTVKKLPSRIKPDKTRIKYQHEKVFITFAKADDTRWEMYREDNFETAQ